MLLPNGIIRMRKQAKISKEADKARRSPLARAMEKLEREDAAQPSPRATKINGPHHAPSNTSSGPQTAERRPRPIQIKSAAELGRFVRVARKRMDLSQQAFADLAGVGRRFVSELESGKPTVEFDKALKVCAAAGIDLFASERSPQ